jgi:hypothetical protein
VEPDPVDAERNGTPDLWGRAADTLPPPSEKGRALPESTDATLERLPAALETAPPPLLLAADDPATLPSVRLATVP